MTYYNIGWNIIRNYGLNKKPNFTLMCVISFVCVPNEREDSVVNQHN